VVEVLRHRILGEMEVFLRDLLAAVVVEVVQIRIRAALGDREGILVGEEAVQLLRQEVWASQVVMGDYLAEAAEALVEYRLRIRHRMWEMGDLGQVGELVSQAARLDERDSEVVMEALSQALEVEGLLWEGQFLLGI
jgi:hypothetical protein